MNSNLSASQIKSLILANKELMVQNKEQQKCITELIMTNQTLVMQNSTQDKPSEIVIVNNTVGFQQRCIAELITTNKELTIQNAEQYKWAAEFEIAKITLTFQKQHVGGDLRQTEKRIDAIVLELTELTKDLIFQNDEKEARASELHIANEELAFQNSEKEKRAYEYIELNAQLSAINEEYAVSNEELITQSIEKEARASELHIANKELAFQNSEKEARASELHIANNELAFQNDEKEARANELVLANTDLAIANEELLFQSVEAEKRSTELTRSYDENAVLVEQMNHMQKLESIGRLTSGIAHDFNNILACVLGYNEMNQDVSSDMIDEELKAELENNTRQIDLASKRAAALIEKMLTYCRQDTTDTKEIDMKPTQEVINEVLAMLHPALTSRIKLEFLRTCHTNNDDCCTCDVRNQCQCETNIQSDAIDLHQILTNLAVNARDAMKDRGGIITFSLHKVTGLNAHCVACAAKLENDFIELSVTDNGTGIESKVISRMFDPFFTTKEQGEGTGLGLSTVSGMVHSAGGHLLVDSQLAPPNQGTVFRLLFPLPVKV